MGNFEKLVVLTILFLSAIVLAVSLNDSKDEEPLGPLGAARAQQVEDGERDVPPAEADPVPRERSFLLSTEIEEEAPATAAAPREAQPVAEERAADGRLRILRDERGLAGAGIDDYMVYTVGAGDTWSGLSQRFYGGGRYVHLLRAANEDLDQLQAGERILVPVYDFAQDAGRREPFRPLTSRTEPEPEPAGTAPVATAPAAEAAAPVAASDFSDVSVYEVQPGDSLSVISVKVYGTAVHWKRLYEANAAVLESPDWLQVGTKLTIPRGAALEALASAAGAASTEPATKTGAKVR